MDGEGLKALFEPFGPVIVRRMFGGAGGYAKGLCFAIEANGEVDIKADALSQPSFSASGSVPFTYVMKGKPKSMSFWRLPEIAHDEADELRRWVGLGLEAAPRAAEAKEERKGKSMLPAMRPSEVQAAPGLSAPMACEAMKPFGQ